MRTECCVPKATSTHSKYIIYIALPLQQWIRERVSISRYTDSTLRVLLQATVSSAVVFPVTHGDILVTSSTLFPGSVMTAEATKGSHQGDGFLYDLSHPGG